jgi:predicted secreted protein
VTRPKRIDALVAAADTLSALDIDQERAVDPFGAIDRLGLDLVIAKLDNLLGAVLPDGNGGVLITSERPVGVQRYTAAHEIGHWILHSDQLRLDGAGEVLGNPTAEWERQAQLFAAYFLMPPPLMEAAVARHGVERGNVRPEQVYLISRDVGVSYEAAIHRLTNMALISRSEAAALHRVSRLDAIKGAFDGHRPVDGYAELWSVDETLDRVTVPVREGDDVLIMLPENRTTGWRWLDEAALRVRGTGVRRPRPTAPRPENGDHRDQRDEAVPDLVEVLAAAAPDSDAQPEPYPDIEAPLTIVGDDFRVRGDVRTGRELERRRRDLVERAEASMHTGEPRAVLVGQTGQRTVAVHCAEPGQWSLDLHYTHAYEPDAPSAARYQLRVDVEPAPNRAYRLRRLATDLDTRLPGDPADDAVFEVMP